MPAYLKTCPQALLQRVRRAVAKEVNTLNPKLSNVFTLAAHFVLPALLLLAPFSIATSKANAEAVASAIEPAAIATAVAKPADIRVLIDVSGSMKQNDPRDLRRPAMDLLVQLFPEGSRGGVWTFGHYVNMLVPHASVDQAWREKAAAKSKSVNSVALHTNIGLALEKANYDADLKQFPKSADYDRSVILLTDGMVDIDKDPAMNSGERQRILGKLLEQYKSAGVTIHTVALSANADTELLETLSLETDGVFAVAENAEDLNRVFLRAFDQAAPGDRVPLADNRFLIDSSIEEFTALVFRGEGDAKTEVISPSEERFNGDSDNPRLRWFSSDAYDLITILQPDEGEWKINAAIDPENRVTIVSNLSLELASLPNNLFLGQAMGLDAQLLELGEPVVRQEFLDLITVEAVMARDNVKFWRQQLPNDVASPGVFTRSLDMLRNEGDYSLTVIADGKTFQREKTLNFSVRKPFRVELAANDEQGEYTITVVADDDSLKSDTVQIVGQLALPGEREEFIELMGQTDSVWAYQAVDQTSGDYRITLSAKGTNTQGGGVDYLLGEYALQLTVPGVPEPKPEVVPVSDPVPEAEAIEQVVEELVEEPLPESVEAEEPLVQEEESRWMLYAALIAGNLLLVGLLYFIYRKFLATPKEAIAAEGDAADKAPEAEAVTAEPEAVAKDQSAEEEMSLEDTVALEEVAEESSVAEPETELPAGLDDPIDLESMLDVDEAVAEITDTSGDESTEKETDASTEIEEDELDALIAEAEAADGQSDAPLDKSTDKVDENKIDSAESEDDDDITIDLDGDFDLSTDITEIEEKLKSTGSDKNN